jgi:hypothetical protein
MTDGLLVAVAQLGDGATSGQTREGGLEWYTVLI